MRAIKISHSSFNLLNQTRALLAGLLASFYLPLACAALDDVSHFQQPAQPLRDALITLGKSTDISIIFPSRLLQGYNAPAVRGEYTTREMLRLLLNDSDLCFKEINPRVVAITPPKAVVAESRGPLPATIEEVSVIGRSVTGSRIRRTDLQGSSPVDMISAPEISLSGSQTLGEFLKYIPAVSGNSTSTAVSNGGDGTATVTLRGLPANNTLVLLNGRRIAYDGLAGDAVDLNSISPAAVERIEILKDGASAVYGSDAIAGVVNIILKKKYDGLLLEQYYGETAAQDLETTTTNLIWGKVFPKSSLFLSATHFDQNGLFSRDREISASADSRYRGGADKRSDATPTSRISLPDRSKIILDTTPEGTYLTGSESSHFRPATEEDLYNYSSDTSSTSPSKRKSVYLRGHHQWTDEMSLEGELSYTKTKAEITLASTPLTTGFQDLPLPVAADNIYNPFGVELSDIRRRMLELGPRRQQNISDAYRFNFELDGYWKDIHWDFSGHWSRTEAVENFLNLLDGRRVQRALGPSAGCLGIKLDGCEPLNLFGPPGSLTEEQLDYIRVDSFSNGFSQLYGFNFNLDTSLYEFDSGPLLFAMGFDIRRESVEMRLEGRTAEDIFIGGGSFDPTTGARSIEEAYAELQIPLSDQLPGVYSLHLELAARHSIYSDFGKSTTPKLGIRYRPAADLLIRATYSEGFRAPSLAELHKGGSQTYSSLDDPCIVAENVGVLPGCAQRADETRKQFLTVFGGEENLAPEEAISRTFGIVWTPEFNPGLLASIDYFNISQTNVVDASAQFMVDQNAYFGILGDRVIRDANGNITRVLATFINIGRREISGLDMTLKYQWFFRGNNFAATLNASHLQRFRDQIDPQAPPVSLEGTFTDEAAEGNGALPEWKLNTGLQWVRDNLETSYTINYVSDLRERVPFTNRLRTIHGWVTHDVQFTYRVRYRKGFRLTIGADNLWDREPPFAASALNDNFDARTHDLRGRFWYARFSQAF